MERNEFTQIRRALKKSQGQLADILCISPKSIQSYEQGWRNIPAHVEREMLLLFSLKINNGKTGEKPCWTIKNCSDEWKAKCAVWELQTSISCWYMNGTYCQGEYRKTWKEKIKLCRQCDVLQSSFSGCITES